MKFKILNFFSTSVDYFFFFYSIKKAFNVYNVPHKKKVERQVTFFISAKRLNFEKIKRIANYFDVKNNKQF